MKTPIEHLVSEHTFDDGTDETYAVTVTLSMARLAGDCIAFVREQAAMNAGPVPVTKADYQAWADQADKEVELAARIEAANTNQAQQEAQDG